MNDFLSAMLVNGGPSGVVMAIGLWVLRMQINDIRDDVCNLKDGKRWTETCESTHKEVDRRLDRLETVANGALKR